MTRYLDALGVALFVLCVLLASLAGARADAPPPLTEPTALARTEVREAGLRAYRRDDGAAIHAVIAFRAEHIYRTSYLEALLRVTNAAPVNRRAPRPWITQLEPAGAAPALFPMSLRWEGYNARDWRRTYQHAERVIAGDIRAECYSVTADGAPIVRVPHAWGDYYDGQRYRRENPSAEELDCGDTCTRDARGNILRDARGNPRCNVFLWHPMYARFDEV